MKAARHRVVFFFLQLCLAAWPLLAQDSEPGGLVRQAQSQANQVAQDLGKSLDGLVKNQVILGLEVAHLGSYDSVEAIGGAKGENSGQVLSVDGRSQGISYVEILGDITQPGVQRFRYESTFGDVGQDLHKLNPLNKRGEDLEALESKKASLQKLTTDIAPFQKLPELVIWLNEQRYISEVRILGANQVDFVPFADEPTPLALQSGDSYYFESRLEELMLGFHARLLTRPARAGFFDMVYQKPVLLSNGDGSFDVYVPKFLSQGYLVEINAIPLWQGNLLQVQADLAYRQSTSGEMLLPLEVGGLATSTKISVHRGALALDFSWKGSFDLSLSTEFIAIYLEEEHQQESDLISLDAMNSLSLVWRF